MKGSINVSSLMSQTTPNGLSVGDLWIPKQTLTCEDPRRRRRATKFKRLILNLNYSFCSPQSVLMNGELSSALRKGCHVRNFGSFRAFCSFFAKIPIQCLWSLVIEVRYKRFRLWNWIPIGFQDVQLKAFGWTKGAGWSNKIQFRL